MNKNLNTLRKFQAIMKACIQTGVLTICVLFSFNTFGNPLSNLARKAGELFNRADKTLEEAFSIENLKLIYGRNN